MKEWREGSESRNRWGGGWQEVEKWQRQITIEEAQMERSENGVGGSRQNCGEERVIMQSWEGEIQWGRRRGRHMERAGDWREKSLVKGGWERRTATESVRRNHNGSNCYLPLSLYGSPFLPEKKTDLKIIKVKIFMSFSNYEIWSPIYKSKRFLKRALYQFTQRVTCQEYNSACENSCVLSGHYEGYFRLGLRLQMFNRKPVLRWKDVGITQAGRVQRNTLTL